METSYLVEMRNVTLSIKRVSRRIETSYVVDHANSNSISRSLTLYPPSTIDTLIGEGRPRGNAIDVSKIIDSGDSFKESRNLDGISLSR